MRKAPDDRKADIMQAALRVAARPGGWSRLTRGAVAVEADCADALISKYYGTMPQFRRAIMRRAILVENLPIIAQGLAAHDSQARKADSELKQTALAWLAR